MSGATRISPAELSPKMKAGKALLVCAYTKNEKFQNNHLVGAISYADFQNQLRSLEKDQEIVFYCAWPNEGSAASLAEKLNKEGYKNAKALKGGVAGWKDAGFKIVSSWEEKVARFMLEIGEI